MTTDKTLSSLLLVRGIEMTVKA